MPKLDAEQREKLRTWLRENDQRLWIEGTPFIDAACDAPRMNGVRPSVDQVRRYRPEGCRWRGRKRRLRLGAYAYTGREWRRWRELAGPHLKNGRSVQEVARRCIEANTPVPLTGLRGMCLPEGVKLVEEAARPAAKTKTRKPRKT
jgi:hypothetical protein